MRLLCELFADLAGRFGGGLFGMRLWGFLCLLLVFGGDFGLLVGFVLVDEFVVVV